MENPLLSAWQDRGHRLTVFGHSVFYLTAGPRDAPPLLVLHGFPTSSLDFHRVLERFAEHHRVVLHDHLGFGLSDKPADYSYSLLEQAEVAVEVWRRLGVEGGHLLAHDYGTSVATELLARRERGLLPLHITGVTLSNSSIHLELAHLRLSQRIARSPRIGPPFARLVPRWYFKQIMRRLWGDRNRVDEAELNAMWAGIRHGNGHHRTSQISSYLGERERFWHRFIGALTRLDIPTHILWGRLDPVATPAIAETLAEEIPEARLTWLEGVGHYPMLEDPESFAQAVLTVSVAPRSAPRAGASQALRSPLPR